MKLTHDQLNKIKAHFKLSNQELEVINLIFSGVDKDIDIANTMKLTLMTIKGYLHRIYLKTGTGKKISTVLKCIEILDLR
jgi:DNA-binding CsgD family transcriptional regulator